MIGTFVFITIFLCLAFLPSIVAGFKKKNNFTAIFFLNLLLGWSIIGWIVALIWSLTNDDSKNIIVQPNTEKRSDAEELEQLAELKDKKIINEEEFEAKKKQILGIEQESLTTSINPEE